MPLRIRALAPLAAIALAALASALALAAPATADTTRADYVAAAEPICAANTDANRRILKGVRRRVKKGELAKAARQFSRAADAFAATVGSLAAIPQPSADATTLATWFGYLNQESGYLRGISAALKHERRAKAQGFVVRLQETASLANDTVTGYGFSACLIDPSKFT